MKIVDHFANDVKNEIFTKIIKKNLKICINVDEASIISNKPVVILFLKIEDSDLSPTIFFDLVELERQGAKQIYASLLKSLHNDGFDNEYLRNDLIAFCSDGANALQMLGRNYG